MANLVTVSESGSSPYHQHIEAGNHRWQADLPISFGGQDGGPAPMDLLVASLGACTTMTLRMYADLKQIPLRRVSVSLTHKKILVDGKKQDHISRSIQLEGALSEAQRQRLLEIAAKCPVARTLAQGVCLENHLATD